MTEAPERIWLWPDDHFMTLSMPGEPYPTGSPEYVRADKVQALVEALETCRDELDRYSEFEYPSDHPVHVRYRKRDYDANTARIALAAFTDGGTQG